MHGQLGFVCANDLAHIQASTVPNGPQHWSTLLKLRAAALSSGGAGVEQHWATGDGALARFDFD